MKTFYVIDGHAQLFRAYYAPFRDLTSPTGEPVKAVYVFTQMLLNIVRNERPDYLAVTFDVSDSSTLRKGFYPEYKANRDRSPEDLQVQYERIREVIAALQLPVFELEGYEADDLIATISERLKPEDVELRIASKDKDLHQVLSYKVKLWDPSTGELLDDVRLRADKGYGPEQAVEIQTLVGDNIDNVPGAKGVGVKTAAKLIAEYGTADAVLANVAALTPKLRENLLAHAEIMDVTRRLVTLDRDAPFDFSLAACAWSVPDVQPLTQLLDSLGFRSLTDQAAALGGGRAAAEGGRAAGSVTGSGAAEPDEDGASGSVGRGWAEGSGEDEEGAGAAPADLRPAGTEPRIVASLDQLRSLAAELTARPAFALDTETTALQAVDADIVGYAFAFESGAGYYVPVRSRAEGPVLDPEAVAAVLKPVLEDPRTLKVGQNLKYDINVLARAGIALAGPLFDTMVAAALIHPERRTNNMDVLARDLLGLTTVPITDLIGKGKNQLNMLDVSVADVGAYAAEAGDVTWRLYQPLNGLLVDDVRTLFETVEMPLVRVLAAMEREGVSLDTGMLREYAGVLGERITGLRAQLTVAAGKEFNPDSPKQLADVLFDDLGLPVIRKTKTGRSTDAEVLETLAAETQHPLPKLLLEYRELTKLLGTYVQPLPGYLAQATGRLHASFHQTGAATGRLSSSEPNIQNIPVRTEAGREIRRAFVAAPGTLLISADYSQVELRMLAHFSKDEELARAFHDGLDIHTYVASQVFGVPLAEVTPDQRRVAKTVNFGIVYGQSAFGLARTLGIPQREAGAFIGAYKERYTGLERFMRECVARAEEDGFVTTILGRRRLIPEVRSRNRNLRQLGERLALNTVIQGSAADLIKAAMVRLHDRLRAEHAGAHLLIQVHDELVLEAPEEEADAVMRLTVGEMTGALRLEVPLVVDASAGKTWLATKG